MTDSTDTTVAPAAGSGAGTRGRPILGAIAGLIFGIALAADLLMVGAFNLASVWLLIVPVLFLLIGAALGIWSPVGYLRGGREGG